MSDDRPIWIHMPRFSAAIREPDVRGRVLVVVMDLLGYGGAPFHPFVFDPEQISASLSSRRDKITVEELEAMRPALLRFFVELPDGRWGLSPEFFSVTDGNPGSEN